MTSDNTLPSTSDPRVEHSRRALKEALKTLVSAGSPETISVSALCKEAGVSRPTFYQHFTTVDDVYGALLRDRLDTFGEELQAKLEDGIPVDLIVADIVERMDREGEHYLSVLGDREALPKARQVISRWMQDWVSIFHFGVPLTELPAETRYRTLFLTGGVLAMLGARISDREALSAEEMSALLHTLTTTVIR